MGLDIVELVLTVEESFEVHLEDDWSDIRTVGDLHRVICRQLADQKQLQTSGACPSIKPFLATRDALLELTSANRRAIRPKTLLENLLSHAVRRRLWPQLQSRTGIRLPPLVLPRRLSTALWVILFGLLLTMTLVSVAAFGWDGLTVSIWAFILLFPVACLLTRPFAVAFPASCQTVGDFVRHARPPAYGIYRSVPIIDRPADIWTALVAIVSEQLDVPANEITPDANFIEDLKCD